MRIAILLPLLPVMSSLLGCTTFKGKPDEPANTYVELGHLQRHFTDDVLANYYSTDAVRRGGLDQVAYRDLVVHARIRAIDIMYEEFEAGLYRDRAGVGVAGSWITLILNGLGAVSSGAANELAAASAGVVGAQAAIDREVLFDNTIPAILATMKARRNKVLAAILGGLKRSAASYSLGEALHEVGRYERAGSLVEAISEITSEAVNKERATQTELTVTISSVAPQALQDRREAMAKWIKESSTANDMIERIIETLGVTVHADAPRPQLLALVYAAATVEQFEQIATVVRTLSGKVF